MAEIDLTDKQDFGGRTLTQEQIIQYEQERANLHRRLAGDQRPRVSSEVGLV